MQLTVLPLLADRMDEKFDVFEVFLKTLEKNETKLEDGDILVISTKYISNSQGRIIRSEKYTNLRRRTRCFKKISTKTRNCRSCN